MAVILLHCPNISNHKSYKYISSIKPMLFWRYFIRTLPFRGCGVTEPSWVFMNAVWSVRCSSLLPRGSSSKAVVVSANDAPIFAAYKVNLISWCHTKYTSKRRSTRIWGLNVNEKQSFIFRWSQRLMGYLHVNWWICSDLWYSFRKRNQ